MAAFVSNPKLQHAIASFRSLAKVPSIAGAFVGNKVGTGNDTLIHVSSNWTQRDLEKGEMMKFQRSHVLSAGKLLPLHVPPKETKNEIWNVQSPSGDLQAIVKTVKDNKGEEKQYVEVWSENGLMHNINITSLDKHGKIHGAGTFGCLEWSHNEKSLLYIAEKKMPKQKSFFEKNKEEKDEENCTRGEQNLYIQQWGEQNVGHTMPVVCTLDLQNETITVVDYLPDYICSGQAVWCPGDEEVVCVGWWNKPYKLGIIYCPIRRSALFHIDLKNSKYTIIGSDEESVRCPRFSPDSSKLAYLQNTVGGPHCKCSQLNVVNWSSKEVKRVLDIVKRPKNDEFPGIFTVDLPRRCWASDSNRIIFTTQWRSKHEIVIIDISSGNASRINSDAADCPGTMYDIHRDIILASYSSPVQPAYLCAGFLSEGSTVSWLRLDEPPEPVKDVTWKIASVEPPPEAAHPVHGSVPYEYILIEPSKCEHKPALMNFLHGGPHSAFSTDYNLTNALLSQLGYAVLMVNYRGSIGFGEDSIDSLPGNIGTMDVQDIHRALEKILSLDIVDADRLLVSGGSHGGFLTAHMIGQYPDLYKAAVCRNPVINIGSMSSSTDIPDWCYVEAASEFNFTSLADPTILEKMWKSSPIQYAEKMKTPLMIMLGAKDLRVPSRQGHELRKALQSRGVKVKTFCYAEECHPLSRVETEADVLINIVKWFDENLPATS